MNLLKNITFNNISFLYIIILLLIIIIFIFLVKSAIYRKKIRSHVAPETAEEIYFEINNIFRKYSSLFSIKRFLKNYSELISLEKKYKFDSSIYKKYLIFYPKKVLKLFLRYHKINENSLVDFESNQFILEFHSSMKELNSYYSMLLKSINDYPLKKNI